MWIAKLIQGRKREGCASKFFDWVCDQPPNHSGVHTSRISYSRTTWTDDDARWSAATYGQRDQDHSDNPLQLQ